MRFLYKFWEILFVFLVFGIVIIAIEDNDFTPARFVCAVVFTLCAMIAHNAAK